MSSGDGGVYDCAECGAELRLDECFDHITQHHADPRPVDYDAEE